MSGEAVLFAQLEVLRAAAGGHVDDAGALFLADGIPGDDLVGLDGVELDVADELGQVGEAAGALGSLQLVEGAVVGPADHLGAFQLAEHLVGAAQHVQGALGEVEHLVALAHLDVGQVGTDGGGDVAGQRPGGGGPDQQGFFLAAAAGGSAG